jgi:alkaline phosphatase D
MWLDLRKAAPPAFDQVYVVNADSWDGYPTHRAELLAWLRSEGIRNVVAVTGDLHAFECGVLYDNADPATGVPVAVDFVSAGISSTSFYQYVRARATNSPLADLVRLSSLFDDLLRRNNPALVHTDLDAQGYAVADVTAAEFSVVFNKVKPLNLDGSRPASPLDKRTRITLQAGSTIPVVTDNVS